MDEDRFMTHLILLEGYGTYINNDALCWTTVPATLGELFKQQLRWRQSILRDLFFTIRTLPQQVRKLHPNALLHMVLTPLGAIVALAGDTTGEMIINDNAGQFATFSSGGGFGGPGGGGGDEDDRAPG